MADATDALPAILTDEQRLAVWLAQYRLANAALSSPQPDSAVRALAMERVNDDKQRASDLAAWSALRETLLPLVAAREAAAEVRGWEKGRDAEREARSIALLNAALRDGPKTSPTA